MELGVGLGVGDGMGDDGCAQISDKVGDGVRLRLARVWVPSNSRLGEADGLAAYSYQACIRAIRPGIRLSNV